MDERERRAIPIHIGLSGQGLFPPLRSRGAEFRASSGFRPETTSIPQRPLSVLVRVRVPIHTPLSVPAQVASSFAFCSPELKTFHVKHFRFKPQLPSTVFLEKGETTDVVMRFAAIARNRTAGTEAPGLRCAEKFEQRPYEYSG